MGAPSGKLTPTRSPAEAEGEILESRLSILVDGVPRPECIVMLQAADQNPRTALNSSHRSAPGRLACSRMTISATFGALALLMALASQRGILATNGHARWQNIPAQAQVISQQAFNALGTVLPPSQVNGSSVS